jgi:hypothetical protein
MKHLIFLLVFLSVAARGTDRWARYDLATGKFQVTEIANLPACDGWLPYVPKPRPSFDPATEVAIEVPPKFTGTNYIQCWLKRPMHQVELDALECQVAKAALRMVATNVLARLEEGQDLDRDQLRDVLKFILMRLLQSRDRAPAP